MDLADRSCHACDVTAPQRPFLWLATAAGLAFLVLTPPLQVPDENRHLNRSYMIAQGNFWATQRQGIVGNPLPWSLLMMPRRLGIGIAANPSVKQDRAHWRSEFDVALRPEHAVIVSIPSTYSPLPYAPQALAIALLSPLEPPPVVFCYAARLLNLAAWIGLIYAALAIAPSHRWSLALLALLPMSVFMAASVSADVLTNGLAFLWLAVVFRLRCKETPLTARDAVGLCCSRRRWVSAKRSTGH